MSFETGTVTGYMALLGRVKVFCETLIAPALERWTVERYTGYSAVLTSSELGFREGFRAYDGDPATEWNTAVGQAVPSALGAQFVTAIDVRRVVIQAPPSATSSPFKAPDQFDLEYSDDGAVWTPLETFNAGAFVDGERKTFTATAPTTGAHAYWRINVATNGGDASHTGVAELELLTDDGGTWFNHAKEAQLIMRGPGLSGSEELFVGMQGYSLATSDIFNWRLRGMTGYVASSTFEGQPGEFGSSIGIPLWDGVIEYWLAANGQRIALVAKVETTYHTMYLGSVLPYATPGQWPYPLAAAGMLPADTLTRYSDLGITGPWSAASARLRLRSAGGAWVTPDCWPWVNALTLRDVPGGYGVVPVHLTDAGNVYGELDGVAQASGFGNAVENTIDVGGVDHLVVQDAHRTGIRDYHTLRLD